MKTLSLLLTVFLPTVAWTGTVADRSVKICVAPNAAPEITAAAQRVVAAVGQHPLLTILSGTKAPMTLTDSRALLADSIDARAYDHLVLIGLPDDSLITAAWQREARVESGGLYLFGFGHLTGDLGYIESDRNPFLHSRAIPTAPYETEVITLTGTTPHGVALAVDAFLRQGLINGIVAAPGWKRTRANLLSRDPLAPDFSIPDVAPATLGPFHRIGFTQAGEDEYRGVLADSGVTPREVWRVKYFQPGAWDGAGAKSAIASYSTGLHRRAYGSSVWCAHFASAAEAGTVAQKVASAAHLHPTGATWTGDQPGYGWGTEPSPGSLLLCQRGEWLLLSTLPAAASEFLSGK